MIFSNDDEFKYIEMINYGRSDPHFMSYGYDEINEFIDKEIKTKENPFQLFKIACHISGDLWLVEEH